MYAAFTLVLLPIRYGRNGAHFVSVAHCARLLRTIPRTSSFVISISEGPSADGGSSLTETCDSEFRITDAHNTIG